MWYLLCSLIDWQRGNTHQLSHHKQPVLKETQKWNQETPVTKIWLSKVIRPGFLRNILPGSTRRVQRRCSQTRQRQWTHVPRPTRCEVQDAKGHQPQALPTSFSAYPQAWKEDLRLLPQWSPTNTTQANTVVSKLQFRPYELPVERLYVWSEDRLTDMTLHIICRWLVPFMSKLDVSHLENKAKTLGLSQMCLFLNLSSWKVRVRGPES